MGKGRGSENEQEEINACYEHFLNNDADLNKIFLKEIN